MGGPNNNSLASLLPPPPPPPPPPLHTLKVLRRGYVNRIFALVYTCAILALFYHHSLSLLHSTSFISFTLSLSLILSDAVLSFMWVTTQPFRFYPIHRRVYPENLGHVVKESDYPDLDVFICTADPYKEPPLNVANTALSVMAYDYPTEKVSVYLSDDGGSDLTLFAFMEAAKFAKHWLPFCREMKITERSPQAYFSSNYDWCTETEKIKMMYETMKAKVESVMEKGRISEEHITSDHERQAFDKWTAGFSRQEHPTVIQVLLESCKEKDVTGHEMPNLVYVSRQKSRTAPHHFKAGALNVLLRVSATMTNAPLILTLDCDMYSNDPQTPLRALCFLSDPAKASELAYIQFPQRFHGVNKYDTYGNEIRRLFIINPEGMDGLNGTSYVGTGCFFRRRAFFGGPLSSFAASETPYLNSGYDVGKSIRSEPVLAMANHVASCNFENGTKWGDKMGFRYGSLVEDYYTGYRLQCEGWKSVFCNPDRAAFLGDVPINLNDSLNQVKRWGVGLLEVGFSKYSPITFGTRSMGPLMALCYAYYAFWPTWAIPITIYAFVPQLTLLNQVPIFPKVSDPWFYLYVFLFLGAYGQDFLDFILTGGTIQKWWNDQRIWLIRGTSGHLFGFLDYLLKSLGISSHGFSLTNKVIDEEQNKRYEQGIFEFGIASPLFVIMTMTAITNLISFVLGIIRVLSHGKMEDMFIQLFLSGFGMVNSWPLYEAIIFRKDGGRMPPRITAISIILAALAYLISRFSFSQI